ncbi:hypothetical protein T439DRAFT_321311 [Meredithblackwellia eburnea MCA 4105]
MQRPRQPPEGFLDGLADGPPSGSEPALLNEHRAQHLSGMHHSDSHNPPDTSSPPSAARIAPITTLPSHPSVEPPTPATSLSFDPWAPSDVFPSLTPIFPTPPITRATGPSNSLQLDQLQSIWARTPADQLQPRITLASSSLGPIGQPTYERSLFSGPIHPTQLPQVRPPPDVQNPIPTSPSSPLSARDSTSISPPRSTFIPSRSFDRSAPPLPPSQPISHHSRHIPDAAPPFVGPVYYTSPYTLHPRSPGPYILYSSHDASQSMPYRQAETVPIDASASSSNRRPIGTTGTQHYSPQPPATFLAPSINSADSSQHRAYSSLPSSSTQSASHVTHPHLGPSSAIANIPPFTGTTMQALGPPSTIATLVASGKSTSLPASFIPSASLPAPSTKSLPQTLSPGKARGAVLKSGLPAVPNRSPWAMWVGNIPSDATIEELWRFFGSRRQAVSGEMPVGAMEGSSGVESIHIISRSNCCFINYISEDTLLEAIRLTNGASIRPHDRRCKPLLCRKRMMEDDARSGVGAQRSQGLHRDHVKSLRKATRTVDGMIPTVGTTFVEAAENEHLVHSMVEPMSQSLEAVGSGSGNDDDDGNEEQSSGKSTTSSFFARWYPKRFFVLKAHSNHDLEDSVKSGLWRTQAHNEVVLDQAFRTCREGVFIFFSANKSGEWFGYARMSGGIEGPKVDLPPAAAIVPGDSGFNPSLDLGVAETRFDEQGAWETFGTAFKVDWQCLNRLPFLRTRHIVNSFNASREVKISRDGTEIEPHAGALLMEEFWLHPSPV